MTTKLKSLAIRLMFAPQVELGYKEMYPTVRNGMINAIYGWPELIYATLQEIKGLFDVEDLLLMANVTQGKEFDAISMADGSFIIKSLESLGKYRQIPHFDKIVTCINNMTAAQQLALCDWCYRYNKMPKRQEEMLQTFAKKEKQK